MVASEATRYAVDIPQIWRVSRKAYAPLQVPPAFVQGTGRFDDAAGEYGVLYASENPRASFVETLAGLRDRLDVRRDVLLQSIMEVEERDAFVKESESTGSVISRHWQQDWQLTSAKMITRQPVFDLASSSAVQFVREQMAVAILALGHTDLDFSRLLGDDRNLTQAISRWIWTMTNEAGQPLFAGIRYRSRFDPESVCIALYENRFEIDGEIDIQSITSQTPGFAEAASTLRLHIA